MIGPKKKKAAYRADVEAALAQNDLAEQKIKKRKRGGGQHSCRPPLL